MVWAREKKDKSGIRGGPKESLRWIEGYECVAEMATHLPETRVVYVADREAELMPLMLRAKVTKAYNEQVIARNRMRDCNFARQQLGVVKDGGRISSRNKKGRVNLSATRSDWPRLPQLNEKSQERAC